jgi:hypothetical protein
MLTDPSVMPRPLMDLPPGWHLSIEDRPSPAARNRLGRELGKHNRPYLRNAKWQWLGVFVREPHGDIKLTQLQTVPRDGREIALTVARDGSSGNALLSQNTDRISPSRCLGQVQIDYQAVPQP